MLASLESWYCCRFLFLDAFVFLCVIGSCAGVMKVGGGGIAAGVGDDVEDFNEDLFVKVSWRFLLFDILVLICAFCNGVGALVCGGGVMDVGVGDDVETVGEDLLAKVGF